MRILGNLFAEQYSNLSIPRGEELPVDFRAFLAKGIS